MNNQSQKDRIAEQLTPAIEADRQYGRFLGNLAIGGAVILEATAGLMLVEGRAVGALLFGALGAFSIGTERVTHHHNQLRDQELARRQMQTT